MSDIYFSDTKSKAVFSAEGPKPQFLFDTPQFKALVVGLEAGGQIPYHPGEAAMYHFLEGEGLMTVDDESFAIKPGVTVVVPSGAKRGMNAKTRVVFLGSKGRNKIMNQTSNKRYHPLQVTLHWLVVLLVIAAFVIGKSMSGQPNDAAKLTPLALHMAVGIITLLVIVYRFVMRLRLPKPEHVTAGNPFFDWVGKAVHYVLYLLVFLMAVSGVSLSIQAGLAPIVFGGSGALPVDFFDFTARMLHGFIAPALVLTVLLHVGAAFYHQFMLKDNLLSRMWYGK